MADDWVIVTDTPPVRVITLNRPEARNALNLALLNALSRQLAEIRSSSEIRALIITGAGDRAFSAGADLKERATMSPPQVRQFLHTIRRLYQDIEALPVPVIAAINGVAIGGGLEMALACDLRLAAAEARFALTETRLAIIPGAGGTQRLPRLIGVARAKELIFTGRQIRAAQALEWGLVNAVVPPERLLPECLRLAAEIGRGGPIALAQAKFAINTGVEVDLHSGLAIEAAAYEVCIPTEDRLEGLAAFREKRQPVYKGR